MISPIRFVAVLAVAHLPESFAAKPLLAQTNKPTSATSRFGNVRDLALAEERELTLLPVKRGPQYPDNAKANSLSAVVPTAFIVDTLGMIEPNSITFLGNLDAASEFRSSVCEFLRSRARFKPLMRAGVLRRAFVVQAFSFRLNDDKVPDGFAISAKQRDAVRTITFDSVAALLENQTRCK